MTTSHPDDIINYIKRSSDNTIYDNDLKYIKNLKHFIDMKKLQLKNRKLNDLSMIEKTRYLSFIRTLKRDSMKWLQKNYLIKGNKNDTNANSQNQSREEDLDSKFLASLTKLFKPYEGPTLDTKESGCSITSNVSNLISQEAIKTKKSNVSGQASGFNTGRGIETEANTTKATKITKKSSELSDKRNSTASNFYQSNIINNFNNPNQKISKFAKIDTGTVGEETKFNFSHRLSNYERCVTSVRPILRKPDIGSNIKNCNSTTELFSMKEDVSLYNNDNNTKEIINNSKSLYNILDNEDNSYNNKEKTFSKNNSSSLLYILKGNNTTEVNNTNTNNNLTSTEPNLSTNNIGKRMLTTSSKTVNFNMMHNQLIPKLSNEKVNKNSTRKSLTNIKEYEPKKSSKFLKYVSEAENFKKIKEENIKAIKNVGKINIHAILKKNENNNDDFEMTPFNSERIHTSNVNKYETNDNKFEEKDLNGLRSIRKDFKDRSKSIINTPVSSKSNNDFINKTERIANKKNTFNSTMSNFATKNKFKPVDDEEESNNTKLNLLFLKDNTNTNLNENEKSNEKILFEKKSRNTINNMKVLIGDSQPNQIKWTDNNDINGKGLGLGLEVNSIIASNIKKPLKTMTRLRTDITLDTMESNRETKYLQNVQSTKNKKSEIYQQFKVKNLERASLLNNLNNKFKFSTKSSGINMVKNFYTKALKKSSKTVMKKTTSDERYMFEQQRRMNEANEIYETCISGSTSDRIPERISDFFLRYKPQISDKLKIDWYHKYKTKNI